MSERGAGDPRICEIRVENVEPKDFGKWRYRYEMKKKEMIWIPLLRCVARCKCRAIKGKVLTVAGSPAPDKEDNKDKNCEPFDWETAFSLATEHNLKRGSLLTTLPTLTKEWMISFELRPTNYQDNSYAEIGRIMIGGWSGSLGVHKEKGVYIAISLDGKSRRKFFKTSKPPLNEWTPVKISRTRVGSKYLFTLIIRGKTLWTIENTDPRDVSDVNVFASSELSVAQAGFIRELWISKKMPGKKSSNFLRFRPFFAICP